MLQILKYLKKYALQIVIVVLLTYGQATAELTLPDYMGDIVNNGIGGGDTGYIITTGIKMLGVAFFATVCTLVTSFISSRVGADLARRLRYDVYKKVSRMSMAEFDSFGASSLITRTTNDIQQVQMTITVALRMVMFAPIMGVSAATKAFKQSTDMTQIIVVALIILIGMLTTLFSIATPKFKIVQKLIDRLNQVTREGLSGIMVVRAFNNQQFEQSRFDTASRDLSKTQLFINRTMNIMGPVMGLLMNMSTVAIVYVGAGLIGSAALNIGDMMAFMQYSMHIIMSFMMVSMTFIMLPRATVSMGRVAEILTSENSVVNTGKPVQDDGSGTVEFQNVSFAYPGGDEPVIKNVSFIARPGQTTAFIGATGSGKSTLVQLVPRFYDATEGNVLVNGVNVRDMDIDHLRSMIGYVPQKGVLFRGDIESNLRFGAQDADFSQIEEAAKIAQAEEFILEKDDKYQSPIAQGGTNVSGGQKQRLCIARALAKNAPIYVFDDSFSALDFKTDAALRAALKQHTKDACILLVAQRVGSIMGAEQIVVLDEGSVAGIGTHKELMQSCDVYREIAESQLSKEELDNV